MNNLFKLILFFLFISLTFGQFGRLPFFPSSFNIYWQDVVILILSAGICFLLLLSGRIGSVFVPRTFVLGLFFLLWSLGSFVFNSQWLDGGRNLLGFSYWLRFFVYLGLYFFLYQVFLRGNLEIRLWAVRVLIFSGLMLAVLGFLQLILLPDLSTFSSQGYDPHKNRLVSTFLDPNFTGAYLVLTLNLIFSTPSFNRRVTYFLISILFTALIFTFSRSAWLMFAVSIMLFGILRSRQLLLLVFLVAFLTYFLVPRVQTRISGMTDPDDSAKLRFVSWEKTMTIARDNLLLGVGFNNFRSAQAQYGFFDYNLPEGGNAGSGSDSSLLLVLATTGIPGLLLYVAFYFSMMLNSLKALWGGDKISLALFISLAGLLVESNFINSLFFTPILVWIFTVNSLVGRGRAAP